MEKNQRAWSTKRGHSKNVSLVQKYRPSPKQKTLNSSTSILHNKLQVGLCLIWVAKNSGRVNSCQFGSSSTQWYSCFGSPDLAVQSQRKHTLEIPFHELVRSNSCLCHSQSPLISVQMNLRCPPSGRTTPRSNNMFILKTIRLRIGCSVSLP